jgi:hypothetical protein
VFSWLLIFKLLPKDETLKKLLKIKGAEWDLMLAEWRKIELESLRYFN